MKRKKQKLLFIEVVLIIAIVLLIGFVGWRILFTRDTSPLGTQSLNENQKVYTDKASVYELTLPKSWNVRLAESGSDQPMPNLVEHSQAVYLSYPGTPKLNTDSDRINEILLAATPTSDRAVTYGDTFVRVKAKNLDGYELRHSRSSIQYGYVDERYLLSNGTYDVYMSFRVKQTAKAGLNAAVFDESDKLSDVSKVFYSVKFLQSGEDTDLPLSSPKDNY